MLSLLDHNNDRFNEEDSDVRALTNEEYKLLISLSRAEEYRAFPDHVSGDPLPSDMANEPGLRIMCHRLSLAGKGVGTTSIPLLLMCDLLSRGIPGHMVIWAHAIRCLHRKYQGRVSLKEWREVFPLVVPTDAFLAKVWDSQKSETSTNLLDTLEPWK